MLGEIEPLNFMLGTHAQPDRLAVRKPADLHDPTGGRRAGEHEQDNEHTWQENS